MSAAISKLNDEY